MSLLQAVTEDFYPFFNFQPSLLMNHILFPSVDSNAVQILTGGLKKQHKIKQFSPVYYIVTTLCQTKLIEQQGVQVERNVSFSHTYFLWINLEKLWGVFFKNIGSTLYTWIAYTMKQYYETYCDLPLRARSSHIILDFIAFLGHLQFSLWPNTFLVVGPFFLTWSYKPVW